MTLIGSIWVMTTMPVVSDGLQVIAGVDQPQADAAADRRDDVAIGDVELGGVDLRLIGRHRRLVLRDEEDLILDLLARDRILLAQRLVAREIGLRLRVQRRVLGELPLRLGERGLDRGAGRSGRENRPP